MSERIPNLARRPFTNDRPVGRAAAILLATGIVLLAVNVWLYRGYAKSAGSTEAGLAALRASIEEENRRLEALESEIAGLDLQRQNAQVRFLNRRIAERTFPWSELFDRLAEVLPRGVRLLSLSRVSISGDERRAVATARVEGGSEPPAIAFPLALDGVAERSEDLLRLVDALFAHPAFAEPNLEREATEEGGLRFSLSVVYRPARPAAPAEVPASTPAAGGGR